MRHINEYLLSKSKNKIVDDFRQFETKEEVCDFLENKGFEKKEFNYNYEKMMDDFEKSNTPLFYISKRKGYDDCWVRFGKGKKDNIFFWRIPEVNEQDVINYEVCDYKDKAISHFDNFEDFKKYVKNYFGWDK